MQQRTFMFVYGWEIQFVRPWHSFAISSYRCCLISKTKIHPAIWQNFPISSRLPYFVSFLSVFSWRSQGPAELQSFTNLCFKTVWQHFSLFPSSCGTVHLNPVAAFIIAASVQFTTISITNFFNKKYCTYLTSSLTKKRPVSRLAAIFPVITFYPKHKHKQKSFLFENSSPWDYRISQTEQNILLQFSQRKSETKLVIFLKPKYFWFSSQSELFCLASVQCWSVCLWSYRSSQEQQAGCLWHIFLVLGRASCFSYCF